MSTWPPVQIVQDILEAPMSECKITAHVPGFAAATLLAKCIGAIVTMPKPIAVILAQELDMDIFQPPVELPDMEIYQYWHERYDRDPGHAWLRSISRSEEHTSELQSLMRNSYAVFCLKKQK